MLQKRQRSGCVMAEPIPNSLVRVYCLSPETDVVSVLDGLDVWHAEAAKAQAGRKDPHSVKLHIFWNGKAQCAHRYNEIILVEV